VSAVSEQSTIETFFERPNSQLALRAANAPLGTRRERPADTEDRRSRRRADADFVTPIPKPKKRKRGAAQQVLITDDGDGISTQAQQYDLTRVYPFFFVRVWHCKT
jgi:hypothetical protein